MELTHKQKRKLKGQDCPYCNRPSKFLKSSESIYGKDYGPIYVCKPCEAWVGCHPGTTKPLGRLAKKHLRELKKGVHDVFDILWKKKIMKRATAYKWLSKELGIPEKYTHIGMFNEKTCRKAIKLCKELIENHEYN